MEYENVLLIGGPHDGEWLSVIKGISSIQFPSEPRTSFGYYPDFHQVSGFSSIEYRRVRFQSDQGFRSAVYVFGDIDPMAALINEYRRP